VTTDFDRSDDGIVPEKHAVRVEHRAFRGWNISVKVCQDSIWAHYKCDSAEEAYLYGIGLRSMMLERQLNDD
jgi:hypothetical protein